MPERNSLKKLIAVASVLCMALSLPLPAQASVTVSSGSLALAIGGDGKTLSKTGGSVVFTSGGSTVSSQERIFACDVAKTAETVPTNDGTKPSGSGGAQCARLYNADGSDFVGTDLSLARVLKPVGNSPNYATPYNINYGAHIVWAAHASVNGTTYSIYTSSVQATAPVLAVVTQPSLTLNGSQISSTPGVWSMGTDSNHAWACTAPVTAKTVASNLGLPASCRRLSSQAQFSSVLPTDLNSAYVETSTFVPYATSFGVHIVLQSVNDGQVVYSASVEFGANGGSSQANGAASAPIKYSGPEFSELSLKPALAGSSATLEGRKLDQIASVTIGGKAAVLSNASDKSVNISLPAGLAPGVYDLVVTTANHGKLTHMNAIRIREELAATSLTIKGTGVFTGEEFKELTSFARTQNPDMNTVTCIVNSNSEGKSFMQARALCDRIAASNLNIKNTKIESRSTVESSAIFARVVFSSVQ